MQFTSTMRNNKKISLEEGLIEFNIHPTYDRRSYETAYNLAVKLRTSHELMKKVVRGWVTHYVCFSSKVKMYANPPITYQMNTFFKIIVSLRIESSPS